MKNKVKYLLGFLTAGCAYLLLVAFTYPDPPKRDNSVPWYTWAVLGFVVLTAVFTIISRKNRTKVVKKKDDKSAGLP